jgi:hypothetical protein
MAREKKYTQTSGEWPCISETAAKFDMSTTLPLPTTHRERQNTREGTGETGSVTSTAELRAPSESNTSPHQQGGVQSPNPPEIRSFASLNLGDLYMDLYSHIVNSARIWRLGIARIATLAQCAFKVKVFALGGVSYIPPFQCAVVPYHRNKKWGWWSSPRSGRSEGAITAHKNDKSPHVRAYAHRPCSISCSAFVFVFPLSHSHSLPHFLHLHLHTTCTKIRNTWIGSYVVSHIYIYLLWRPPPQPPTVHLVLHFSSRPSAGEGVLSISTFA